MAHYPDYRKSTLDWLDEVPSHWVETRLRYVAGLNPSKSETSHRDRDEEVSFIPMEAVGEEGSLRLDQIRTIGSVETGYTYFADGDVTVAKITPCFENGKGAVMRGLKGGIGFGTTELTVARPYSGNSAEFLHWLFTSTAFRKLGEGAMYGAGGQKRVPDEFIRNFSFALPSSGEQSAIAAFLERETGKIDALIEAQTRLIELLKEKRQAVISHAVTKGLNPDTPMKDTGIEWLGQVPAHWEVGPVKRVAGSIEQGWSPQCESYPAQGPDEWGVLKVGCVNGGRFSPEQNKALPTDLTPLPELGIRLGDLLVSRANTRELVGSAAVAEAEYPHLLLCDKLYRLRTDPERCAPGFLALYLGGREARSRIEMAASGASASMQNIGQAVIMELPMPLPPCDEQNEVLMKLKKTLGEMDNLTDGVQSTIAILQERRAALISAAVTGKIDVRGLVNVDSEAA